MSVAMAFLLPAIVSLLFTPWLVPFFLRRFGAIIGLYIKHKTSARREQLCEACRSHKEGSGVDNEAAQDDDEWERIESYASGSTPNGGKPGQEWRGIVGFFHPFCNAGGGGERVLWAAIRATQLRWPEALCVVYTGDHDASKAQIIKRVQDRFNITLNPSTIQFLYLSTRSWVLASTWPRFTLLGQSIGSLILALDAFNLLVPDIFVDTMGYAFALWFCKFLFPLVPTAAYVHYPTISTDMLESLDSTRQEHGVNAGAGKGNLGKAKRAYWQVFALLYSRVGGSIDVVMTNSSWTQAHIKTLWGPWRGAHISAEAKEDNIKVVFPPVAVEELEEQIAVSKETEAKRLPHLLYIAQFRPEKNHTLIVTAFAKFITSRTWSDKRRPKLVLVGSVRDSDDATRVYKLRLLAHELQIKHDVDFVCDASWPQVLERLGSCSIGVNGMWNEHFGIGVVEYQAAGLISVVNRSGGPKLDIVVDVEGKPTGYHASTAEEYAAAFAEALDMSEEEVLGFRERARKSAERFTERAFAAKWVENMAVLVEQQTSMNPHR